MLGYDPARVAETDAPQPNALVTHRESVSEALIDYNGHMTEWQYYRMFADAGEALLRAMGFTEDYRLRGYSFFSVEGHMRNLRECRVGTRLEVQTEMLGFDDRRLHIYQYLVDRDTGVVHATGEHMMVHVDTGIRRAVPALPEMLASMAEALRRWGPGVRPKGAARAIRPAVPEGQVDHP